MKDQYVWCILGRKGRFMEAFPGDCETHTRLKIEKLNEDYGKCKKDFLYSMVRAKLVFPKERCDCCYCRRNFGDRK